MLERLAIFGASGDLTSRYLLPALASLHELGYLPERFEILGLAQDELDTAAFRERLERRWREHVKEGDATSREAVLKALRYHQADVTDEARLREVLKVDEGPLAVYLALPPAVFAPAIRALKALELAEGSRMVVEKPFGEDLQSARELNRLLHEAFPEEAIFRVDHFLGKQTVQNILGLRFANRIFEPVWNCNHVAGVEIRWDETLALEGRANYYDRTGALKDMIQNHLLQLLCLVAMEAPHSLHERDLRDRKVDVLRAVRKFSREEVARYTVRARYTEGRIGDREVPSYIDEEGVDPERGTETFAQVTLFIDNWRWSGVPFTLRSGKALAKDHQEIAVQFRPVPHLAFGQEHQARANALRLKLSPDRLELELNVNAAGDPFELEPLTLDAELAEQRPSAYGRLLLDVLQGDPTLSIRGDEAEEAWRIMDPILDAWAEGVSPLQEYEAGSSFLDDAP
jgi:glucose-6-phosphate 1-dehydrogenase